MANTAVYVDSHATGGTNSGTSWTNAYLSLATAITNTVATTGIDYYVHNTHVEAGTGTLGLSFKGAVATPDRVFSCGTTNTPPTSADLATGAFLNSTTAGVTINGFVYIYGCTFQGASGSLITMGNGASDIVLDTCESSVVGTTSINIGGAIIASSRVTWINTKVKFTATGAGIKLLEGHFRWLDTVAAIDPLSTLPTTLFAAGGDAGVFCYCAGVDFSLLTSKALTAAMNMSCIYEFVNCQLNGNTFGTPTTTGAYVDLVVTDSAVSGHNYRQERYCYQGILTTSTTVFNNATDGDTPISWQVAANANANPQSPFECFDIVQWAPAGTYNSTKVQTTCATGSLTVNDIWVEVEYLGSSYPLAALAITRTVPLTPNGSTPGALSTSGGSWATGGQGNNYVLAVPSFTTSADGYVRFRVKVGNYTNTQVSGLTVYIDPAVVIA